MYQILNEGPGSPGETARVMTNDFLKRKIYTDGDDEYIFRSMLKDYANTYSNMGMTHFDNKMIDRIVLRSNGELLFIIFADILVTNYNQFVNNMSALISSYDLIFEIVLKNYNSIVEPKDYITNTSSIKENIYNFIEEEMKRIKF